ncbi:MAG: LysM peptidoglycan-binding domain-containing protein [Lachnospiraceae bacterium]|nr:LysM peptidoglycan-binding domain-containing protein [Lachnospiraceae bacterium]
MRYVRGIGNTAETGRGIDMEGFLTEMDYPDEYYMTRQQQIEGRRARERYLEKQRIWRDRRRAQVARYRMTISAACAVTALLMVIAACGILRSDVNASVRKDALHKTYTNITVTEGDNLWNIAKAHITDPECDASVRACVDEIKELNSLGFYEKICPGDRLVVPTYSYEETTASGY